ncbi:helix-turn-helix transcriptional regulator [Caproicibacter sp.]|uniref:helix-turn-helix transcriptional regulator n=1 Tax=Caproicibacter sp. TaxID=2814884 RepID=UPI003988F46A
MRQNETGRIRILALLELLDELTDEEHPLSSQELIGLLQEQGISTGRKTVYRDVSALRAHGLEILFTRKPKAGFFLAERRFEPPEVRLLMDAVQAAPFLTEKKTAELMRKLSGLTSVAQAGETAGKTHMNLRPKYDNEEIYYTIDAINRAVAQKKKISFLYRRHVIRGNRVVWEEGRRFVISPYALIWDSDKYYLAGNYEKYDDVSVYRLDRIKHAEISARTARPFHEVSGYRDRFDAEDYAAKTFHLYHGELQTVVLRCADEALEPLLDKFGGNLKISERENGLFHVRAKVFAGEGLVEWLLQYGDRICVLSPQKLRDQVAERVRCIGKAYGL